MGFRYLLRSRRYIHGTKLHCYKGCSEHNLKNVDVEIPRDELVVITVFRIRKSSLAFDTMYAEGSGVMWKVYPAMRDSFWVR